MVAITSSTARERLGKTDGQLYNFKVVNKMIKCQDFAPRITKKSVEVHITTSTGTLYGTQIIPTSNVPEPVVLIIAGSGPTDRDGNNPLGGPNNSLKLLAEGLAGHGIASIRYDKRGIGESSAAGTKEVDLRFDTYVEDAALWIQQLQADSRFSSVTVIGHSEGSLIGMLATQKTWSRCFCINSRTCPNGITSHPRSTAT
jgi:predicted alpha/beta hydrolase